MFVYSYYHHQNHVAGEGHCVFVALCPRPTAHLQISPMEWVQSSWSCFVDDQVGDATYGHEVDLVMYWHGAKEPCLQPVYCTQAKPHAQKEKCVMGYVYKGCVYMWTWCLHIDMQYLRSWTWTGVRWRHHWLPEMNGKPRKHSLWTSWQRYLFHAVINSRLGQGLWATTTTV